jgi:hypothetical protein
MIFNMYFFAAVIICLFIFLYCVHFLTEDDFVFLRKNVSLEKIFNVIFVGIAPSIFFSRFFYGVFRMEDFSLNPFSYFFFGDFPGLSLSGFVFGAGVYFLYLTQKRDLPVLRIADIFSIAFTITLPVGLLGSLLFINQGFIEPIVLSIFYFVLFIVFLKFIFPEFLSGRVREGSISLIFLACFSLVSFIANLFPVKDFINSLVSIENTMLFITFGITLYFLAAREKLLLNLKKIRRKSHGKA